MVGYALYFLLAVSLTALFTAAFRRLRHDDHDTAIPVEDVAFDRRMAEIATRYDLERDQPRPPGL